MTAPIDDLIGRARAFLSGDFTRRQPLYRRLVRDGQSPRILMVACSDSRVDPSVIFDAQPGDIFMVRNVASLVPPWTSDKGCHGTSAAIEFGILGLGVEHVIVLGHGHCGGIDALLRGIDKGDPKSDFIGPWLSSAASVRDRVAAEVSDLPHADQARKLELATVNQSLRNLMSFPFIAERVGQKKLALHGWHFDIAEGALCEVGEDGTASRITG